jgi:hypothetical protein
VLTGPAALLDAFYKQTSAADVPNLFYPHHDDFDKMLNSGVDSGTRSGVPAIYWVNNSFIEYKSTYYQLDPKFMENWIK